MFALIVALAMSIIGALPTTATQSVSDTELQRLLSRGTFPIGCQESNMASYAMRAKPTTDPTRLRDVAKTFTACADGPYGQGSNALRTDAQFRAAAALLLAARYDTPQGATYDATTAKALADDIIGFRFPTRPGAKTRGNDPSPYVTDAGRIQRDSVALLTALNGSSPT